MTGHFGFSYIGFIFLLLLFIPNIIWTKKMPQGYEAEDESRILLAFERIGEVLIIENPRCRRYAACYGIFLSRHIW